MGAELFGPGLLARSKVNDDKLGRALDRLFAAIWPRRLAGQNFCARPPSQCLAMIVRSLHQEWISNSLW